MAYADYLTVDEITQAEDGVRWLLQDSPSAEALALRNFLETYDPSANPGQFFLHDDADQPLPGEITVEDTPCLIMAPTSLPVELWRNPQGKATHTLAILGFLQSRTTASLNEFIMRTLRALFERSGRIPDTVAGHDPLTDNLDHVSGMLIAGPIQRNPVIPLSRSQEGDLDLGDLPGYRWWGFRMLLSVRVQIRILGG